MKISDRQHLLSAVGLVATTLLGCQPAERSVSTTETWSILPVATSESPHRKVMSEQPEGEDEPWATARDPREILFPQDHAAHPDFRIEWWYYTGNLQSADGRRWGYQLTFFRTGVQRTPNSASRWAVRDLHIAHAALSDLQNRRHRFAQRIQRQGLGQAGAHEDRYHVWNGNWSVRMDGDRHLLSVEADDFSLSLELVLAKPLVLHGDRGLSRKGASPGNASYYYSATRMESAGQLTVHGRRHDVQGASWMDHEFSTSFLESGQVGWDWFALQLSDGSEIMLYQIRGEDGTADPFSSGSYVHADGQVTRLAATDFALEALATWKSPRTGGSYPTAWRVNIPRLQCQLEVRAAFAEQEMATEASVGIPYWEGSIAIQGRSRNQPVTGQGYLEMTGYAGERLGAHRLSIRSESPDG